MKVCHRCWIEKPIGEFNKQVRNPDGLQYWCRECKNAWRRERYATNPEFKKKRRTEGQKWLDDHKEERIEASRAIARRYVANHPERILANSRLYRKSHPGWASFHQQKRRTRLAEVGGSFTYKEWIDLCEKYDNRCLACGRKIQLTIDHVIPITREGSTNNIENIQPLCGTCNSRKHNRIIDYRQPFVAMAT